MNRFLALLKKEFLHIFRDPRTMMILFGMPIIQILLFGYVIKNEVKDVGVVVLDYARDVQSQRLIQKIEASDYFYIHSQIEDVKQIDALFKKGDVQEAIIIPHDFSIELTRDSHSSVQLILDGTDPNYANLISKYTTAIIQDFALEESSLEITPTQFSLQSRMYFNEEMKSAFLFVPGTMAFILMLLSALMSSISIAREKEFGSMEVLLVSPLKPIQVVSGKVMPYVILAFVNAISVILVGNLVFGVPVHGSMLMLMLVSILFVITALSLGIMISTIANNQETAMMVSMFALMLPTLLLSGFIFPVENMPKLLQWLSCAIPARWFLEIIKSIMLKAGELESYWEQVVILIGMSAVFLGISVKNYKLRLE